MDRHGPSPVRRRRLRRVADSHPHWVRTQMNLLLGRKRRNRVAFGWQRRRSKSLGIPCGFVQLLLAAQADWWRAHLDQAVVRFLLPRCPVRAGRLRLTLVPLATTHGLLVTGNIRSSTERSSAIRMSWIEARVLGALLSRTAAAIAGIDDSVVIGVTIGSGRWCRRVVRGSTRGTGRGSGIHDRSTIRLPWSMIVMRSRRVVHHSAGAASSIRHPAGMFRRSVARVNNGSSPVLRYDDVDRSRNRNS